MARLAAEADTPLRVFLLPPSGSRSYDDHRPLFQLAAELVREAGLPVKSLLDGFAATGRRPHEFAVNSFDGHPSADYNVVAVGVVLEHLRAEGLVE